MELRLSQEPAADERRPKMRKQRAPAAPSCCSSPSNSLQRNSLPVDGVTAPGEVGTAGLEQDKQQQQKEQEMHLYK